MRAVFVSDMHAWYAGADMRAFGRFQAALPDVVEYIVGDAVDSWAEPREDRCWPSDWPVTAKCWFVEGNHDPRWWAEPYLIHRTASDRKILVIHGHQFDPILHWGPLAWPLAILGTEFNERLLRTLHFSAAALVAEDASTLRKIHRLVAERAAQLGCSGAICGHTHRYGHSIFTVGAQVIDVWDCGCWLRQMPHGFWYEDDDGEIKGETVSY